MFNIKKLLVTLCTFLVTASVWATPTMIISDGVSTPITIVDQLTPPGSEDLSPLPGQVSFAGFYGGWTFTIDTGVTKPMPGSDRALSLQVQVSSIGAGTLTIDFSEVDFFALPGFPYLESSASNTTNAPGADITFETFLDDSNTLFGTGSGTELATFNSTSTGFGETELDKPIFTDPFSLTGRITVTHTGAGTTNADLVVEAVPEPTTIALLGLTLIGMSLTFRQRGRRAYA